LRPDEVNRLFGKAVDCHVKGRLAEALSLYDAVIRLNPNVAAAHCNRALVLQSLGKLDDALKGYNRAIRIQPNYADAYFNRAIVLRLLNRPGEAVRSYDQAIQYQPHHHEAYNNRGNALRDLKRLEEALQSFDQALRLKHDFADAHHNKARALREMGRLDDAVRSVDNALALKPDFAEAHFAKGTALQRLERFEEALLSYDRAIELQPDHAEALNNRGNTLKELKRFDEALKSYDAGVAMGSRVAEGYWNKSLCKLLLGNFDEGWPLYEWRKSKSEPFGFYNCPLPPWTGKESLAGKTLLVRAEQGLGDTIEFSRYAPLAQEAGAQVILAVPDVLTRLLKTLHPDIGIERLTAEPVTFDYHIALMSMPLAFGTTTSTCPAMMPYLHAEPEKVAKWKERIGCEGFKIGICWQGNRQSEIDLGRSFLVRHFGAVARLPNVRLISLQKNDGVEQLEDLPSGMKVETLGDDFDSGPDAFIDTAAVMECLDLVITSDTAIAHLGGALARPTWVALKYVPDWRWLLDRADSPWYPTMKLFRQPAPGDWPSVFDAMQRQLAERTA
jgi:tetratricopeptide (TPR) repeat protein